MEPEIAGALIAVGGGTAGYLFREFLNLVRPFVCLELIDGGVQRNKGCYWLEFPGKAIKWGSLLYAVTAMRGLSRLHATAKARCRLVAGTSQRHTASSIVGEMECEASIESGCR